MPSCSRPSRSGLDPLEQAAPAEWRPSLTAARRDGDSLPFRKTSMGTLTCHSPTEDLYRGCLCAPPRLAVAQHSIENYNELPHDGRDYIFEWIAFATQTIGKCFYNGIGSHSDARCHVERTSYGCATGFYVAC